MDSKSCRSYAMARFKLPTEAGHFRAMPRTLLTLASCLKELGLTRRLRENEVEMTALDMIARPRPVKPPSVFASAQPVQWSITLGNATGFASPPSLRRRVAMWLKKLNFALVGWALLEHGEDALGLLNGVIELVQRLSGMCVAQVSHTAQRLGQLQR